ncbi:MAG: cadherin-like domain-containing protein [Candidatus Kerfeldbacteria bacterium]|nr:cadherin-like domain-containing protein [Candidatus Kerfeldbacteria bacterium]
MPNLMYRHTSSFLLTSVVVVATVFIFGVQPAYAVVRTWDGGGSTNNWTEDANWSDNTEPGSGDVATFDATSTKAATVDGVISVGGIDINVGYSGTITQSAQISVGNYNYDQADGIFTGGSASIILTGDADFVLSGGTFTATSGTTTFPDEFTHTAGTFNHNSGTVNITGWLTMGFPADETFNTVTLNMCNSCELTVSGGTMIVLGDLTINNGGVMWGTVEARGNVTWGAGSDAQNNGANLQITGTGDQTLTMGGAMGFRGTTTVNKASGNVYLGANYYTVSGTFVLTNGTFYTRDSGNTTNYSFTHGNYSQGGGIFNGGSSTVTFGSFSEFTLSGGTYNQSSGTTTYGGGNWTHTAGGTFNHNSGTSVIGLSPTFDVMGTETFGSLTMNGSNNGAKVITSGDTLLVTGTFTLNEGLINTGTLEVQGDVTIASGFDGGSTTMKFSGSATQSFTLASAGLFNGDITVNKSGGAVNLASALTMDASSQDLTIQEGTFDLSGFALSVTAGATETIIVETGGNLQLQGGETITADSASYPQLDSGSTVTYDGASGPYTLKNYTYHHLTVAGGASSVFTLAANESFAGNVTLTTGILSQGGFTMAVVGTFANNSTLRRLQIETFTGTMDVDSGTVEYVGDGDGSAETITITEFGVTDYFNLKINDVNVTKDIFALGAATVVAGTLQVTSSEFQQGANALTPAAITVDGGTLTGGSSAITVSGAVTISAGTFTGTTNTLSVSGAWTHTAGGTWTHNSGTVALIGAAATADVSTSETFSALNINKTDANTLTIGTGDTLVAVGTLTLTNGTWGTGNVEAQGNVVVASTWDAAGTGTLTFGGSGTQTFDLTGAEAALDNPVTINKSGGSVTLASAYTMNHANADFTLTLGTFNTGNYTITTASGADMAINGGTWNSGSSVLDYDTTLTIDGGTYNVTSSSGPTNFTTFNLLSGAFNAGASNASFWSPVTISGGTFTASSSNIYIRSSWTHTAGGTFVHNSGTAQITDTTGTIDVATTETFYDLTINNSASQILAIGSGDTLVATGTLTLTDGAFATGTIAAQGNVVVGAAWDAAGSGALTATGAAVQTLDLSAGAGLLDNPLTINKSGGSFTLASAYTMDHANADFTVTLGTFSTGNFAMTTSSGSDIAINSGTFNAGSSTMTIAGLLTVAGGTYNGNTSSGTISGAFALSSTGAYNGNTSTPTFSGGLTISGGVFTATSGTMTVSANFAHTAGTFTHNSGTVAFNNAGVTSTISGSTTFYNLSCTTALKPLTFTAGTTQTVSGLLTLTGTAGNLIVLRSTVDDTYWNLIVNGTQSVSYVNVKDSDASGGTAISQANSTDAGHNSNWVFNFAPSASTTLYTNNTTTTAQSGDSNPGNLTDGTPVFSALYIDTDTGDIANKYCVQVNTATDFSGTNVWYADNGTCSSGTTLTNITAGNRSSDIEYAGNTLSCGTTYYWRIKFWDDTPAEGSWSSAANFQINCRPTVSASSGSTIEDTAYTGDLEHSDGDNDTVTYAVVSSASHGVVTLTASSTGGFTYTPNTNFNGTDSFTYRVTDGTENADSATFTMTVTAVNDSPVAAAGSDLSVSEDSQTTALNGTSSSDVDATTLSYSWSELSDSADGCSLASTTIAQPSVTVANRESNYSCEFRLVVSDGTVSSAADTVTLNVTADNDTPTITVTANSTVEIDEGDTLVIPVSTADVDTSGVSLSAAVTSGTLSTISELFIDNGDNTGTFSWSTTEDDAGEYTFRFAAADAVNTASSDVHVTVNDVISNTAPAFSGSLPNVAMLSAATTAAVFDLDDYFSDPDGDTLSYTMSEVEGVSASVNDGKVRLSADEDFASSVAVVFTATDTSGATAQSNPLVIEVSAAVIANVSHALGTKEGSGKIQIVDSDGNVVAAWQVFPSGGVIPRLGTNGKQSYVFAVKRRSGSTIHVYSLSGELVVKKRLSPKLHWRKLAVGNLDDDISSEEIVIATRRGSHIYFRIYSYHAQREHFKLKARTIFTPMRSDQYSIKIQDSTVRLYDTDGKTLAVWRPHL